MTITHRHLRPEDLAGAFTALGTYETPLNGYIRVVYTRQAGGNWRFYIGQCVLEEDAKDDQNEVYRNFAFIQKAVRQVQIKALLERVTGEGIEMAPDLPPVRLATSNPIWNEEIIPSHAARFRTPFRRFTASFESNAFCPDGQLIDYTLPYRPSAARYVKKFLDFKVFHGANDARNGEFCIEVPDRRGAIRFAGGHIAITAPTTPLRLVGAINGEIQVDVRNDNIAEYDEESVHDVELWLMTKDSELVDYMSTTEWAHKFDAPGQNAKQEQRFLELIRRGESETCEFKPYINLSSSKASELEKTVCAFSNQRGGTLFIGVNDEGDLVGLARDVMTRGGELEKALAEYENGVRTRLRESLRDNQCYTSSVATVSGALLVVVEVRQAPEVNYIVKSELAQMAYTRHGATSVRMSPPEIQAKGGNDVQSVLRHRVYGP